MDATNLYWTLVASAFVLIGAELILPGAVLGLLGCTALLAAVVAGFAAFGAKNGLISAFGLLIGGSLFLFLWVKYCPGSFFGKWFTLQESGKDFKSFDDEGQSVLVGKTGVAHSDLRPSGIALIDGKRIDVISEAGFIARDRTIKVILAQGPRIVVREVEPS